jgi:hypothetical protein
VTTGVEAVDALSWAGAQLLADSAFVTACPGLVHIGVAPQGTNAPVCVIFVQSAPEYQTFNGVHIWTDTTLMVKISGPQDNFPAVRTAAARAYAVLQRHTGGAQGATMIACILTQSMPVPEPALVNGVQWISFVQLFRVLVQ